MSSGERFVSWILKGGLLLTPFLVFVVSPWFYFPFITGKNFIFRILIQILAAVWVVAIMRFPRFRPNFSPLFWAVLAFTVIMGLATVFSLSPYRSFWSNFERMEGYIGLLHLIIYFFLLISVFKRESEWNLFLHTSIVASILISFYAILQLAGTFVIHQGGTRVDATLGNATYLAAYLLFHLFFLAWFFMRSQSLAWRIGYGAAFILELVILYYTATRGAILGFLGGMLLFGLLLAVQAPMRIRRWAWGGVIVLVLIPILFFAIRNTGFVQNSPVLDRFAEISFSETTTKSRFTIWGMAVRGWQERPVLGWGQESFIYVFSKYYEPSLWRQEPWFDRAHNVFLDWLIAGGTVGLAAYLGMYASAGWLLIRSLRRGTVDGITFGAVAALLAAHFFQNLFVFDNLTSYLLFFAVLAYVHARSTVPDSASSPAPAKAFRLSVQAGSAVFAAVLAVLVFYQADLKPMLTGKAILDALKVGQQQQAAGKVDALLGHSQHGTSYQTFGTMEIREQLAQNAAFVLSDQSLANQDKAKYLEYAIGELEKQRAEFPYDVRAKVFLSSLYLNSGQPQQTLRAIEELLKISERRQQFYFIAAEASLNIGDGAKAVALLERAYNLAPDYPEAIANLATVLILTRQTDKAEAFLTEKYGEPLVAETRYVQAYLNIGELTKAIRVQELVTAARPQNYQDHANLGILYARRGRTDEAIRSITRAIELEPQFKAQGEDLITQIRGGTLQ